MTSNGSYGELEVDNFESQIIRDPQLRELWRRSMDIGGLPEKWVGLKEEKMRSITRDHSEAERVG
jgi:hypothetical protein